MKYSIKNYKILASLIILSFLFFLGKWINSFSFFPDESVINKILFEIPDFLYFPYIHNLANLNFGPSYSSLNETLNFIPLPYASLIFHSVIIKIIGYSGFILLELLSIIVFLYIFFLIFKKINFSNTSAILLASFLFVLPSLIALVEFWNILSLKNMGLYNQMIHNFYGLRIPRPAVSNLYFFAFTYFLINFYKEKTYGNFFGIFIGVILSLMWVSFYYHFSSATIALIIIFFLKYNHQLFHNLKKEKKLIVKIVIYFFITSIPLLVLLNFSEPDYTIRVGLTEFDWDKKIILLDHLLKSFFAKEFILMIILNSLILWYVKKKQNLYCAKSIEAIFVLFISSIISPFLFIAVSPVGSEMYHFFNLVIATGIMFFFISFMVLAAIFFKTKIIKNKKILFLKIENLKFLLIGFLVLFYNFENFSSSIHTTLKSESFYEYRTDFNEITSKLSSDNVNLPKQSTMLTFNDMFQTWWILSDYKYLSVIDGAFSSRKTHSIEDQLIDSFKFLKLDVNDFLKFFENKKDGSLYKNENVATFMYMTYTANSLKTFNDSKNFDEEILDFIENTSPFYNQQLIIPNEEFERLEKKFIARENVNFIEPDLIILKKDNEISEKMIIQLNKYCELKNDIFFVFVKRDKINECK